MRLCASLFRRRRGPAGLRSSATNVPMTKIHSIHELVHFLIFIYLLSLPCNPRFFSLFALLFSDLFCSTLLVILSNGFRHLKTFL